MINPETVTGVNLLIQTSLSTSDFKHLSFGEYSRLQKLHPKLFRWLGDYMFRHGEKKVHAPNVTDGSAP
jgi:hypothetical protein